MTLEIDKNKFKEVETHLKSKGFSFENRPHQIFLARGNGVVVNLYNNGKAVIAGSNKDGIKDIENFLLSLEAKQVEKIEKEYVPINITGTRIGTDEAGKGDYFGPLVIAGALVTENQVDKLRRIGIRDSKLLSDTTIQNHAVSIKRVLEQGQYEIILITPVKYNILYKNMRNLNRILGWGHARAIENLLMFKEPCDTAIADQFGDQSYIFDALMKKGKRIRLMQVPKAEREISVATASILARAEFIYKMREMGEIYGVEFPKGSSHVLKFSKGFVEKYGYGALQNVAKIHFSTTEKIQELNVPEITEEVEKLADTERVPILYEEREREDLLLECYNLISSFEYEFRRFIQKELQTHYGDSWWSQGIDKDIRGKCEKLRESETKKGKNVELIDYLDFKHYQLIITDRENWDKIFSKIFKNKEHFLARLRILESNRHPIAHSRRIEQRDKIEIVSAISYFKGIINQMKMEEFLKK